ncbi:hypothetical protein A3D83_03555 [Candidatus Daviesbacteria bacterium RIFCSPHIGHO2_02_FULL_41_10]|uniref:UDP-glucose 6-dehydrogenase n=1 Tax=Candidatus Daviesbacteria bacterium RIFCSPHIGHO2_02_FULL_41_10 TaxID=1797774 RepID=A0A1F5JUN9_9BACT|nr:MAG: hypothetical protein A3D83_03555 [Candidatus Daviesbacteria bacterium RIFCSPHIGHO2_02_FULL_41_10]
MKIAIVGTGYVGLITGVSLAVLGHQVICIDEDPKKVSMIKNGKSPFFEPQIDQLLKKVTEQHLFTATTDLAASVLESDVTFIAVGTPTTNNRLDLSYIKKASEQIGKALKMTKKYHVIAVKSTVLPGVTEKIVKPIIEKYSKKKIGEFGLCMNPEFLREGSALEDALNPDRIVIGQIDNKSGEEFAKIYNNISAPKIFTNLQTAEMTKYASNSLLATLISFSNEMARLAEAAGGIDITDVWRGVHLDKRLSPFDGKRRIKPGILNYILSGCGFGGSCFPKDIKALANFAKDLKVDAKIIESVIDVNNTQPQRLMIHLKNSLGNKLKNKRIVVLGLAFKPNTDDLRESPAFPVIEALISGGSKVIAHDPIAYQKNIPKQLADLPIILASSVQGAVRNADAVIVITSWAEYIKLTPQFFKKHMKIPIVIDGRRIYDKNSFLNAGIIYKGIGLS